ncbi:MAG: triose-phosphate isomerase [Elusimicrobia bacterium RIFCSPLOWO2_01_FULL_64_13]|nr:MAG: triose-phosphate isomerase [Elusimicrobia bacterium RIFCSPHIGHO2_01_FULL_64_10]OGR97915.1 MAG: triose-phosphate isomerase [Elusimicrobia bacterium RIFCSPLOWO2_01_FULL_64_13]
MCKTIPEALSLVDELKASCSGLPDREILVCPPATSLESVSRAVRGSFLRLGAQNLHWESEGAFTGEISGRMLASIGCAYVIVGHSERRQYFSETDAVVQKKIHAAYREGLVPILCVGETLEEREKGLASDVAARQIRQGLSGLGPENFSKLVVAYEPVWAIGTGRTASPAQAQEIHAVIRGLLSELYGGKAADGTRLLYGGSIKPDNIDSLMAQPDIDGGLVGGASLKAPDFARIVKYESR